MANIKAVFYQVNWRKLPYFAARIIDPVINERINETKPENEEDINYYSTIEVNFSVFFHTIYHFFVLMNLKISHRS